MYPSGVGTSYADPRRSNYTKSQSLQFQRGTAVLKDMAESSANGQQAPSDELGSNLRRGKGLSFSNGIAQFDRFGGGTKPSGMSRDAEAASETPNYDSYMNHKRTSANYSSANGGYMQGTAVPRDQSDYRPSSSGRDSRYIPSSRSSLRPQTAPSQQRGPSLGVQQGTSNGELPAWAKDEVVTPSFDKTVETSSKRPGSARSRPSSARAGGGLPMAFVPKWISQDKKILTFEAYFKESVHESHLEHYRVRRCVISYFLEDDTIKVSEPREENSGMPQGIFLRRHKVVQEGINGGFMTWRDIKCPGDLSLYGRTFRVTKCDSFTEEFYTARGYRVSAEESVPMDPVREQKMRPTSSHTVVSVGRDGQELHFHGRMKNDMTDYIEARLGRCQDTKARVTKYLANDRKVLRFYATWNDKTTDAVVLKRPFIFHFFLADDTVEVLEVKENNSGRDPFPAMLKRMRLPKNFIMKGVALVGGDSTAPHYTAADLRVGGVVTVFGRQLVLDSCDEATRQYYYDTFGVLFPKASDKERKAPAHTAIVVPPHNGFGKEEDSRQNCISLHPKAPKANVIRLLENKGKMLRYVGKLEHAVGFDVERSFTITYFLDTDEILIFEPPKQNCGRTGGKFMERCRVRKPSGLEYYSEADLFLGARIVIYSRRFVLVDADEFTVKYMENHPSDFPYSDPGRVQEGLRGIDMAQCTAMLRAKDSRGRGAVSADVFKECLVRGGLGLNDMQAHTLARHFAEGGLVPYEQLMAINAGQQQPPAAMEDGPATFEASNELLRSLLYRRGPGGVRGLHRAMRHVSRGTGSIDRADFDTVLGFCGVALSEEQASAIFARHDAGDGIIESAHVVEGLRMPMSRAQERAVMSVFESMEDPTFRTGAIEVAEALKRYKPGRHPRVMMGEMTEAEAMRELEDGLEGLPGTAMASDLLGFYADIVAGYHLSDAQLVEMLRATWGLSGRKGG